jgi:hypothetical protein
VKAGDTITLTIDMVGALEHLIYIRVMEERAGHKGCGRSVAIGSLHRITASVFI